MKLDAYSFELDHRYADNGEKAELSRQSRKTPYFKASYLSAVIIYVCV